jgi:chemotaxis protein histidine kinase CheA
MKELGEKQMTTKECYEKIGSNYDSVLSRFGNEALVKRFALKFLKDPSYADLKEALEVHDAERAFRAAHTLKGVCLNLGFDRLYETSAALTEDLRGRDINGGDRLFPELTERYEQLTEAIRELEAEA